MVAFVAPVVGAPTPSFADDASEIDESSRCWLEPDFASGDRRVFWTFENQDDWDSVVMVAVRARVVQWNEVLASDGRPYVEFVEWQASMGGDGDPSTPSSADFVIRVLPDEPLVARMPCSGSGLAVEIGGTLAKPTNTNYASYAPLMAEHTAGVVLHEFGHVAVQVVGASGLFGHTSGRATWMTTLDPFGWDHPSVSNVPGTNVDAVPVPPAMLTCAGRGFGPDYEGVSTPWDPPLDKSQWGTVNQQLYPTLATVQADDAAFLSGALDFLISPGSYEPRAVTANSGFERLTTWWKKSGGAWAVNLGGAANGQRWLSWTPSNSSDSVRPAWPTVVGSAPWEPVDSNDHRGWVVSSRARVRGPVGGYRPVQLVTRYRTVVWSTAGCTLEREDSQHGDGQNWNGRVWTGPWHEEVATMTDDLTGDWQGFSHGTGIMAACHPDQWNTCNQQGLDVWTEVRMAEPMAVELDDVTSSVRTARVVF